MYIYVSVTCSQGKDGETGVKGEDKLASTHRARLLMVLYTADLTRSLVVWRGDRMCAGWHGLESLLVWPVGEVQCNLTWSREPV